MLYHEADMLGEVASYTTDQEQVGGASAGVDPERRCELNHTYDGEEGQEATAKDPLAVSQVGDHCVHQADKVEKESLQNNLTAAIRTAEHHNSAVVDHCVEAVDDEDQERSTCREHPGNWPPQSPRRSPLCTSSGGGGRRESAKQSQSTPLPLQSQSPG